MGKLYFLGRRVIFHIFVLYPMNIRNSSIFFHYFLPRLNFLNNFISVSEVLMPYFRDYSTSILIMAIVTLALSSNSILMMNKLTSDVPLPVSVTFLEYGYDYVWWLNEL